MNQPRMILVGGFLGAGKTTLLAHAARLLLEQGKRVGLITNDQAADLVDTALLHQAKLDVKEIAGGCFCCRFGQLIETAEQLVAEMSPDIIIGEPVGSCTDLSATVLQPIKALYSDVFNLAPLSILVDPNRLREALDLQSQSPMHPSALYILRKQLEESDFIVINKIDLLSVEEQQELLTATQGTFPGKPIYIISAVTGEGVAAWLDAVQNEKTVGANIVDIDYDIYAEGEAMLGWLNASATITASGEIDWKALCLEILNRIQEEVSVHQAEIAHVKLSLTAETGQYMANLISTNCNPTIHGRIDGSPCTASLIINARVEMTPESLQTIVEDALESITSENISIEIETIRSLSPGRPTPTHRYKSVV
ncbi:MAG: GTP-binding protein [Armatimonadota bacterium]